MTSDQPFAITRLDRDGRREAARLIEAAEASSENLEMAIYELVGLRLKLAALTKSPPGDAEFREVRL